jgi:hypothetical protein
MHDDARCSEARSIHHHLLHAGRLPKKRQDSRRVHVPHPHSSALSSSPSYLPSTLSPSVLISPQHLPSSLSSLASLASTTLIFNRSIPRAFPPPRLPHFASTATQLRNAHPLDTSPQHEFSSPSSSPLSSTLVLFFPFFLLVPFSLPLEAMYPQRFLLSRLWIEMQAVSARPFRRREERERKGSALFSLPVFAAKDLMKHNTCE